MPGNMPMTPTPLPEGVAAVGAPFATPELAALRRLLEQRHSCRAYLPRPVPTPVIEQLLETAQRTASWCNTQPWQVVVTRGEGTERFRAACRDAAAQGREGYDLGGPLRYQGVYLERRRECAFQLYESVGVPRGDREAGARQSQRNFEFFGAPHVAIVTTEDDLGVHGAVDCGSYIANFMNAATALGLGCIAQAALASLPGLIRRHFGLPASRRIVCGISFGYPDATHPVNRFRTSRASLDQVVTWVGEDPAPRP